MITFFEGPEGAGKTALMTKFCRYHHLKGGHIWAFPGYEHKNQSGNVISELINPIEIMGKIDELQYIVLCIDEMQNFMNHHAWQNPLIDVLAYGAMAQRRKREFVVLATGPSFDYLPPDLRYRFHCLVKCRDLHWGNHDIPRGERIEFLMIDLMGVLSGKPWTPQAPQIFYPKSVYKFYDTLEISDPKYQHMRISIRKDKTLVDSEGNIIEKDDTQYQEYDDRVIVAAKVEELRSLGYESIDHAELAEIIEELGLPNNPRTKRLFYARGIYYDPGSRGYKFKTSIHTEALSAT